MRKRQQAAFWQSQVKAGSSIQTHTHTTLHQNANAGIPDTVSRQSRSRASQFIPPFSLHPLQYSSTTKEAWYLARYMHDSKRNSSKQFRLNHAGFIIDGRLDKLIKQKVHRLTKQSGKTHHTKSDPSHHSILNHFIMYFTSSITLLLLPLALADKTLRGRGLVSDPIMTSSIPLAYTATKGVTSRQAGPCDALETAYQQCLLSLPSTQVDSCIDCVNGKFPEEDEEGNILCTDYLDFHCNAPASCSACVECANEMSAWGVCDYDNSGCPPAECRAGPTEPPEPETPPCTGGDLLSCVNACLSSCPS